MFGWFCEWVWRIRICARKIAVIPLTMIDSRGSLYPCSIIARPAQRLRFGNQSPSQLFWKGRKYSPPHSGRAARSYQLLRGRFRKGGWHSFSQSERYFPLRWLLFRSREACQDTAITLQICHVFPEVFHFDSCLPWRCSFR